MRMQHELREYVFYSKEAQNLAEKEMDKLTHSGWKLFSTHVQFGNGGSGSMCRLVCVFVRQEALTVLE